MMARHLTHRILSDAARRLRFLALVAFCAMGATAVAQQAPSDPEGLAEVNLLVEGGFADALMGCDCGWQIERASTPDGSGDGVILLSGGLPGAVEAIHQRIVGLAPGEVYVVALQWRAQGDEADHSAVNQTALSVALDGEPLHQLVPAADPSDWTTHEVQFEAQGPEARLTLRTLSTSPAAGILLNYVSVTPLEEGFPPAVGDIAVVDPLLDLPPETTASGLPIPPLPAAASSDDPVEVAAPVMPTSTRLMAYSIDDEVRDEAESENYYIDADGSGGGNIILGQGLNFDVLSVDEVLSDAEVEAFAGAAMSAAGIDLRSEDVIVLRVADGELAGQILTIYDDNARYESAFTANSAFVVRPPLETEAAEGFVSLEAVYLPGQFVRHQGFVLKLDPITADSPTLDRRDATFEIVPVSAPGSVVEDAPAQPVDDAALSACVGLLTAGDTLDWGGGTTWGENNARMLCDGVTSADDIERRFSCFSEILASSGDWQGAIADCTGEAPATTTGSDGGAMDADPAEGSMDWLTDETVTTAQAAPSETRGPLEVGIRWQTPGCEDVDLDLYLRGEAGQDWLYWNRIETAFGTYGEDIRAGTGGLEMAELSDAAPDDVEVLINHYSGECGPISGILRATFGGEIYEAPFTLPAGSGDEGAGLSGATSLPAWVVVSASELFNLGSDEAAASTTTASGAAQPVDDTAQPVDDAALSACVGLLTAGGTLDWGGGTMWAENNARALCAGVTSAEDIERRFSCFSEIVGSAGDWQGAIADCTG